MLINYPKIHQIKKDPNNNLGATMGKLLSLKYAIKRCVTVWDSLIASKSGCGITLWGGGLIWLTLWMYCSMRGAIQSTFCMHFNLHLCSNSGRDICTRVTQWESTKICMQTEWGLMASYFLPTTLGLSIYQSTVLGISVQLNISFTTEDK